MLGFFMSEIMYFAIVSLFLMLVSLYRISRFWLVAYVFWLRDQIVQGDLKSQAWISRLIIWLR
jgi:hypothetical protein